MRTQIGWYDPGSKRFVYSDVKESTNFSDYDAYVVPVFADDETDKLRRETLLQVLENQCAFISAVLKNDDLDVELRRHLIKERGHTIALLEKGRKDL